MTRILIVGGGMTSAATASLLKANSGAAAKVKVKVWDKARGVGGRMSTSRSPFNPELTADLGAQYFTKTPTSRKSYFDELVNNGLLVPLTGTIIGQRANPSGSEDFVTPHGCSSLVKHFFGKGGATVQTEHHVSQLQRTDQGSAWKVTTAAGVSDEFDVVILTMPVPQILELMDKSPSSLVDDSDANGDSEVKAKLKAVKYSSRYAMALFYDDEQTAASATDFLGNGNGSAVCAKYIDDDPVFRYVSVDTTKRGGAPKGGVSVVLHTTVPFGVKHVEKTPDEMKPMLMSKIRELFPAWPEPTSAKCQKWRYSQASQPYEGSPGCVTLSRKPLLVAGGDAFVSSVINGCFLSAEAIAKQVEEHCAKLSQ